MNETGPGPSTPSVDRPRVAVVFGGRSGEHAISCVSGAGVLRALDRDRYDVVAIGITRDGRWVPVTDDPAAWEIDGDRLPEVTAGDGTTVLLPRSPLDTDLARLVPGEVPVAYGPVDVVLPLLHGPYGEDGTIQGMLELAGIRYVGSGVLASALGMDKHHMKIALAGAGIPVVPAVVLRPGRWEREPEAVLEEVRGLGLPVFVKPARAGSSLGITRVTDLADLPDAIAAAAEHDPKVLVETAVVGREIECAVLQGWDGAPPRTSLPGEIVPAADHDFYDFEAKYLDAEGALLRSPTDLPAETEAVVRDLAARTFEAIGCEGLARVDTFVTPEGDVVVNEINTMPGFTPISMYPRMWEASGLPYADLVDELVRLALARPAGLR